MKRRPLIFDCFFHGVEREEVWMAAGASKQHRRAPSFLWARVAWWATLIPRPLPPPPPCSKLQLVIGERCRETPNNAKQFYWTPVEKKKKILSEEKINLLKNILLQNVVLVQVWISFCSEVKFQYQKSMKTNQLLLFWVRRIFVKSSLISMFYSMSTN